MLEAMWAGLGHLASAEVLLAVLVGVFVGSLVAAIPGLGGAFAIGILFPVALLFESPFPSVAMIVATVVVSGTANTMTGVMFGVPGSSSGVALLFDGYPMGQRGEAKRAIGAGLTASLVGGVFGALLLAVSLPIALLVIRRLGPPEFFAMICTGLVVIAFVQDGPKTKALIGAGLGLMVSFIGIEPVVGQTRFTMGSLYLQRGLSLVPVIIGVFALAQMVELGRRKGTMVEGAEVNPAEDSMLRGVVDVFRYWKTTLQSSTVGTFVGFLPGLGGPAAQFAAYAAASRTAKTRDQFGKGAVEGVIAADAATNAKEGGALIPTLGFGIPGAGSMALLLAALVHYGIHPGVMLLEQETDLVWLMIWVVVLANVVAVAFALVLARGITLLTLVPTRSYVPALAAVCLFGAYTSREQAGDVIVALIFGVVGYLFIRYEFSRATFIIGFVLGPLLERYLLLSRQLYAFPFFERPITVAIYLVIVLIVLRDWLQRRKAKREVVAASQREDTG